MAKRRKFRNLVPLALLGVLTVGAAIAAAAAGLHQHDRIAAASTQPTVLQAADAATAAAGTVQFTLTTSTSGPGSGPGSTTRGFGSVNFTSGSADAYMVTSEVVPEKTGTSVPVTPILQEVVADGHTYEKESTAGIPAQPSWLQIAGTSISGPLAPLQRIQFGAAVGPLVHLPSGATVRAAGTSILDGVPATGYTVSIPLTTCSQGGDKGSVATASVLTVWLDGQHRIRELHQQTFEKITQPGQSTSKVAAFTSTLTLSSYGAPVHITAPTPVKEEQVPTTVPTSTSRGTCSRTGWVAYAPLSG